MVTALSLVSNSQKNLSHISFLNKKSMKSKCGKETDIKIQTPRETNIYSLVSDGSKNPFRLVKHVKAVEIDMI